MSDNQHSDLGGISGKEALANFANGAEKMREFMGAAKDFVDANPEFRDADAAELAGLSIRSMADSARPCEPQETP